MLSKISNIYIKDIVSSIPKISNFNNVKINSELKRTIDLIGVEQSYKTNKDTTTLDLCLNSARHLLKKNKIESADIEIVIFVTQTPDYLMPSCSNIVHDLLGLKKSCICFDINMGCSGYVYGLWTISTLMESNNFKNGLLLVGDTISKSIRNRCF